ncbi:MAG TPA: hypothetical protein ENH82_00495 [bacterium]|nr:hypothetical protein [bacterium]
MNKHFLNAPVVYKLGTKFIRYIPTFISYAFARTIADISYFFYKSAAKKIIEKLSLVFPGSSRTELSQKARRIFRNYAEYLIDYGRFSDLDKETLLEKIVHFDGEENLINALNMHKGVILLTAHLGNWELGGIFFSAYGLKVNVITLPDDDTEIDSSRSRYREHYGINTITVGGSPFSTISIVNALNDNELVAMLIDRYSNDKDSVSLDFFNKPALFPKGPFVLSRITGAPIIVAFVVKEKGEYKGIVNEPFIVESESREVDSVKKVVRVFEEYIVQYSDQWYDFR